VFADTMLLLDSVFCLWNKNSHPAHPYFCNCPLSFSLTTGDEKEVCASQSIESRIAVIALMLTRLRRFSQLERNVSGSFVAVLCETHTQKKKWEHRMYFFFSPFTQPYSPAHRVMTTILVFSFTFIVRPPHAPLVRTLLQQVAGDPSKSSHA
jgi:hypothetical protein